jgi:hypothetical protein
LRHTTSNLNTLSTNVGNLDGKITSLDSRTTNLEKIVSDTKVLLDAREQLALAIKNSPAPLTEGAWAIVLRIALYENIVVLIAAIFIIIEVCRLLYWWSRRPNQRP